MQRKKITSYQGTRYPDLEAGLDRRAVLRGLGGLAGVLTASSAMGGCFGLPLDPVGGTDGITDDGDVYDISLPPDPQVRTLYFEDGGYIDYHVDVRVDSYNLFETMGLDSDVLLAAIDDLLAGHSIYDFAPGVDTTTIDAELLTYLRDTYAQAQLGDILWAILTVDEYDAGEEIDGLEGEDY